jgi:hypothetical protein
MLEISMFGACPKEAQGQVHELLKALIVTDRENFKVREIGMIAGSGKDEVRIYLTCDQAQVSAVLYIVRPRADKHLRISCLKSYANPGMPAPCLGMPLRNDGTAMLRSLPNS